MLFHGKGLFRSILHDRRIPVDLRDTICLLLDIFPQHTFGGGA
jgi:hypothetical protein